MMSERSMTTMSNNHMQDNAGILHHHDIMHDIESQTERKVKMSGPSIFEQIRGPEISEGDRFINFRGVNECYGDKEDDVSQ